MAERLDHYIAGAFARPALGKYIDSFEPRSAALVGSVAAGDAQDVDAAARAAGAAAAGWRDVQPIVRGRILAEIARKIREYAPRLAELESRQGGKPMWQAVVEVEGAAKYFEFYAGLVNLFQGEKIDLGPDYHAYTVREPYGVVAVITPWNAALNQASRGIAPALAAGNVVIAKPSEFTSAATLEVARIACEESGLPPGVWNVVLGDGSQCGAAVVSHPAVRKVAFTGSTRAGREIGRIAADRIIPVTLELGGKSPNIVFADADLSLAIPGALRVFSNAGQICTAPTRLLVEDSIHDRFLAGLKEAAAGVTVGPGPDARVGALTTRGQFERVQEYFEIARQDGAQSLIGGEMIKNPDWGDGWFVPPTIYTGVTNDMRIAREEIFGPVLSVIRFSDEAEAIRIANDTDYGLAAGIWTQNLSRAHRVAAALQAGQIYVNEYQAGGVETPLGGYKNSGFGREKGIEALHHYTQLKCVTIKL